MTTMSDPFDERFEKAVYDEAARYHASACSFKLALNAAESRAVAAETALAEADSLLGEATMLLDSLDVLPQAVEEWLGVANEHIARARSCRLP